MINMKRNVSLYHVQFCCNSLLEVPFRCLLVEENWGESFDTSRCFQKYFIVSLLNFVALNERSMITKGGQVQNGNGMESRSSWTTRNVSIFMLQFQPDEKQIEKQWGVERGGWGVWRAIITTITITRTTVTTITIATINAALCNVQRRGACVERVAKVWNAPRGQGRGEGKRLAHWNQLRWNLCSLIFLGCSMHVTNVLRGRRQVEQGQGAGGRGQWARRRKALGWWWVDCTLPKCVRGKQ